MTKIKKILRSIVSLSLAFIICSTAFSYVNAAEETADDTAVITFSKFFRTKHIKDWKISIFDNAKRVTRDGREGVQLDKDTQTLHLLINVDDNFIKPEPEGTEVQVEVDYYDEGEGNSFNVRFASTKYATSDAAGICRMHNTKQWKTHTFILRDALFDNSMNDGYDLSISEWNRYMGTSKQDVVFGEIRIKQLPKQQLTAEMTTGHNGNMFDGDDAKSFKLHLKNRQSAPVTAKIKAEAFDYMYGDFIVSPEKMSAEVVSSAEKEVVVENELDTDITLDLSKYGSYAVKITLDCTDENGYNRVQTINDYFSIINHYEKDEPKNEGIGFSAFITRFFGKSGFSGIEYEGDTMAKYVADMVSELGFGYIRSGWTDSRNEAMVDIFAERKIKIFPTFSIPDELYDDIRRGDDTAIQKLADTWTEKVKSRPDVSVWELANEVNAQWSVDQIIKIYKAAYTSLKAAAPDKTFLGLAYAGSNYGWLKEFYEKGGGDYMDGLAIHLYDDSGSFNRHWWYEKLPELKEILVKYGQDEKPVWFSEQGWSTYEDGPTTEWDRTISNVKYWTYLIAEDWMDHFMIYNLCRTGSDFNSREQMFGVFREEDDMVNPVSPLPVCVSLNAMNRMLNKTEAMDQIIADNDMAALYRFKYEDGSQVIAAWSDEGNRSVCLNLGTNTIKVYDLYGNETGTLYSGDGIFELPLTDAPQYIKGNFTKFEETEPTIKINNRITAAVGDDAVIDLGNNSADIKIEVESELENKVDGNKVSFKCPVERLGDNDFKLRVYVGGKLYYDGSGTLTIVDPLKADMVYEYSEDKGIKASLNIKNISDRYISAATNVSFPDYNYDSSNNNNVVKLKPGEQKEYAIRLPDMNVVRIMKADIKMTLDNGYSFTQTDSGKTLTYAKYTDKKPVIDGSISPNEWNGIWLCSDSSDRWHLNKEWGGKDDLSFIGNLMWDEEALYMAIDVTDDTHTQPYTGGDIWRSDGIQFGFSNVAPPYPADTEKFEEFQAALSDNGILTAQRLQSVCGKALGDLPNNVKTAISQKGTHTIYEMKIPWTEIFGDGYKVDQNSLINFGLIVNDTDNDSPRGYLDYNDGIGSGKNYKLFKPIHLIK